MRSPRLAALAAVVLAACAPTVDAPVEAQRARDRDDGDRLARQLATLPHVARAAATIRHEPRDPLAPTAPTRAPTAAIVIVADAEAARAPLADQARALVRAVAPEVDAPTLVVELGAPPVELVDVGPFRVARESRTPLRLALVAVFVAIAGLALALAARARPKRSETQRRGISAQ